MQMKPKTMAQPEKSIKPEMQPLRWGTWPSNDIPLEIVGQRGKWSFVQPWACGSWEAVLVVPWKERLGEQVPRVVVQAADVRVPIAPASRRRERAPKQQQSA
jgi:hypothetical protein